MLLVLSASLMPVQHSTRRAEFASALVTEVFDQHLATLASNLPPQVLSSDRHTVKPWFQGKLPFSFNLPENLPGDTTLDGANLTYLHNQPVAQLLYSIGKHRVSVFVRERNGGAQEMSAAHSGFQVREFVANDLDVTAVSDVDAARLAELVSAIRGAQIEPFLLGNCCGEALKGTVTLPPGLQGSYVWQGKEQALRSGDNQIAGEVE